MVHGCNATGSSYSVGGLDNHSFDAFGELWIRPLFNANGWNLDDWYALNNLVDHKCDRGPDIASRTSIDDICHRDTAFTIANNAFQFSDGTTVRYDGAEGFGDKKEQLKILEGLRAARAENWQAATVYYFGAFSGFAKASTKVASEYARAGGEKRAARAGELSGKKAALEKEIAGLEATLKTAADEGLKTSLTTTIASKKAELKTVGDSLQREFPGGAAAVMSGGDVRKYIDAVKAALTTYHTNAVQGSNDGMLTLVRSLAPHDVSEQVIMGAVRALGESSGERDFANLILAMWHYNKARHLAESMPAEVQAVVGKMKAETPPKTDEEIKAATTAKFSEIRANVWKHLKEAEKIIQGIVQQSFSLLSPAQEVEMTEDGQIRITQAMLQSVSADMRPLDGPNLDNRQDELLNELRVGLKGIAAALPEEKKEPAPPQTPPAPPQTPPAPKPVPKPDPKKLKTRKEDTFDMSDPFER